MAIDAIGSSGIGFANYSQTKASAAVSKNQGPQETSRKTYSSVEEKGLNKEPVRVQRPTTDRVELQQSSGVSESAKTENVAKKAYTVTDNPAKTAVLNSVVAKAAKTTTTQTATAASSVASTTGTLTESAAAAVRNREPQLPAESMAELIKAATAASERIESFRTENNKASDGRVQELNNYAKDNTSKNISQLVTTNATQNQMAAVMMMR